MCAPLGCKVAGKSIVLGNASYLASIGIETACLALSAFDRARPEK